MGNDIELLHHFGLLMSLMTNVAMVTAWHHQGVAFLAKLEDAVVAAVALEYDEVLFRLRLVCHR